MPDSCRMCIADLDDEVLSIGSRHVGAASRAAAVSPVVHLLAEGSQGVEAVVCLHPHIATAASIATCWPTCVHKQQESVSFAAW